MTTTRVRALSVDTAQGHAGMLTKESRHVFAYETGDSSHEVSLIMPIRAETYADTPMLPVFAMNRPEGYLLDKIQRAFKHHQLSDMALLAITGENQIGRLRYRVPEKPPRAKRAEIGLTELLRIGSERGLFDHLVETYLEAGISGFQPKVMIPDADRVEPGDETPDAADRNATFVGEKATAPTPSLILKTSGEDYPNLAVNEFLCMDAARRAGIAVPKFWLSDDRSIFVMERFDVDGGVQFGFEDMAVLMRKNHTERNFKYSSSYENVARMIALQCRENAVESLKRFFEYFALSVLVRNGDAHLKNFGLLYEHPAAEVAPRLAPLFDVVTTSVYLHENQRTGVQVADRTMALKLNKSVSYPTRDELYTFGRTFCHVSDPAAVIQRIGDAMADALTQEGWRLDTPFREALRVQWDQGRGSLAQDKVFGARPPRASAVPSRSR
jgi:serine/threonine-protein kinase HipA